MRKLDAARTAILQAPLGIRPDQLQTFAQQGTAWSRRGPRNRNLRMDYQAHLIVTDYTGSPRNLFFVLIDWLHRDNPAAADDAVTFHVDILDHGKADVSVRLDLTETIHVEDLDGGLRLTSVSDPDAQAIDMAALFPDLAESSSDDGDT